MAGFTFSGRDAEGRRISGSRQAATADLLAAELQAERITPLEIRPSRDSYVPDEASASLRRLFGRERVDLEALIVLSRQMACLCKAGVPIVRAIGGLAETASSIELRAVLREVSRSIEGGHSLTQALSAHPKVFSALFVAMVRVGENTGRLDEAFRQLSDNLELERETRKRVRQATRYPIFVMVAISVALVVINWWVIPAFARIFEQAHVQLPLMTRLLLGFSGLVHDWWWLLLGLIAATVVGVRRWLASGDGSLQWDRMKLRIPLVGPLFARIALARFTRTFAMMYRSGLPLLQILAINAQAVGNRHIGAGIDEMRQSIERGDSLTRAASVSGLFTPLVLQMLAVGEETGALDELFLEVADFYDQEVEFSLRRMADSIEPLLISVLGVLVLVVALGVMLPMWDLSSVARGGR